MKTDKYAILTDAIKYLKAVQSEHSQLKQLNKFLEVSIRWLSQKSVITFPDQCASHRNLRD